MISVYEATSAAGIARLKQANRSDHTRYQIGVLDSADDHHQAIAFALELAQLDRLRSQLRERGVLELSNDSFDSVIDALVRAELEAGHECHARCVLVQIAASLGIVFR